MRYKLPNLARVLKRSNEEGEKGKEGKGSERRRALGKK